MSNTCERPRRASPPRLAVVVSGWPRISETFAVNELLALQRCGMLTSVFATKPGDPAWRQPGIADLDPLVEVLPPTDAAAQGAYVAERLDGAGVAAVHGYFAHRPAEVAAAAAHRLGVSYGFSAHALDVRKVPADEFTARAAGAAVVVSCNAHTAASISDMGSTSRLVSHGVDLRRFAPTPAPEGETLWILAVGRLVEKKGFDVLLDALTRVDGPWRLRLVGDGPDREPLEQAIGRRGLGGRVELLGRRTHGELPALYAAADVVVVPSVVDRDGDRDGLPNVVLEAMASGRPVVASDVAAIGSVVEHEVTGLLVPPRDAGALAQALARMQTERPLAAGLGAAARTRVEARFDLHACGDELCRVLEQSYG